MNIKKKLFTILLSLVMVVTMMPMTAFESHAATTVTGPLEFEHGVPNDGSEYGYTWDEVNDKLTLNGFTMDLSGYALTENAIFNAMTVPAGTTLTLGGANSITTPSENTSPLSCTITGIRGEGDLNITGSGSLAIDVGSCMEASAIRSNLSTGSNMKIDGVTLNMNLAASKFSYGIYLDQENDTLLIENDADVSIEVDANNTIDGSRTDGIYTQYLTISKSKVYAHAGKSDNHSYGICSTRIMNIKNGAEVYASSDGARCSVGIMVSSTPKTMNISGYDTKVTGLSGTAPANGGESFGIAGYNYGIINIYGGEVIAKASDAHTYSCGVYSGKTSVTGGIIYAEGKKATNQAGVAASVGILGARECNVIGGEITSLHDIAVLPVAITAYPAPGLVGSEPKGVMLVGTKNTPAIITNGHYATSFGMTQQGPQFEWQNIATSIGNIDLPSLDAINPEQNLNIKFADFVAEIPANNKYKYTTLRSAIEDCYDNNPSTATEIKLLQDITLDEVLPVTAGKNIKLNMNGHKLKRDLASSAEDGNIFNIEDGAKFEIVNGTLTGGNNETSGGAIYNQGELTLDKVKITGNTTDVVGGGIFNTGILKIKTDCIITGNTAPGYLANLTTLPGKVTVLSALGTSNIGYSVVDENLEATAGALTTGYISHNNGAGVDTYFHYNGDITHYPALEGNEIVVKQVPGNSYTISTNYTPGGVITTDKAIAEEGETVTVTAIPDDDTHAYKSGTMTYTGGVQVTMTGNTGTFTMPAENVSLTCDFIEYQCEVDSTKYETLQDAVAACSTNEKTIKLLNDVELQDYLNIPADSNITLDLNGKTLSAMSGANFSLIEVASGANLTITGNGILTGGNGNNGGAINNSGTLVTKNITIKNSSATNGGAIYTTGSYTAKEGTVITGCNATTHGSAIHVEYPGSCTISDDAEIKACSPSNNTIFVKDTDFTMNSGKLNGDIICEDSPSLTFNGGIFTSNIASADATVAAAIANANKSLVSNSDEFYKYQLANLAPYNITLATVTGGAISADATANAGSTVTVTISAESGYTYKEGSLKYIKEGQSEGTAITVSGDVGTFIMPASNITLTCEFDSNQPEPEPTPTPTPHVGPTVVPVELLQVKVGTKSVKLTWNEVEGATKYVVSGQRCGKDMKKLKTLTTTSYTVKSISGKKLVAHKNYKFQVVAYDADGNKIKSRGIHVITANTNGKYGNVKSIKAKTAAKTLAVGKTYTVKATYKIYGGKKHLPTSHGAALRFTSNCPEVATVNSKGKVTAKKAGTATIYIQDIGGKYCKTEITVK